MYVCTSANLPAYADFVVCQTFKPHLLNSGVVDRAVVLEPRESNGCFNRKTLIDCSILFRVQHVQESTAIEVIKHLPDDAMQRIDFQLTNPEQGFRLETYTWDTLLELLIHSDQDQTDRSV